MATGREASGRQGPGGGYSVVRPLGRCAVTGREIAAGERFHAGLRESPGGLERVDVSLEAWGGFDKSDLLASWQTTMPAAERKQRLFVDDEVLLTLFERLAETVDPAKVRFRFVLGLILMRKRLVTYESQYGRGAESFWTVRLKGRAEAMDLRNPHLSEEQVGEVAGQLSEILASEL